MATEAEEQLLKVVTFNLKRDGFGSKNRWSARRELAAKLIEHSGAGIIGVQELLPSMRQDVQKLLTDYSIVGTGRYQGKNTYNDEHADIIVRNDCAEVREHKTFWLSKRPEKAGSRGTLALFPRVCTMAEIYLKPFDRFVRVFNTHLDHVSAFARVLGVRIILEYMSRYNKKAPMPTILMGDMNAKPGSRAMRILRENLHFHSNIHLNDVYLSPGAPRLHNTYHSFKGIVREQEQPIDYIFVSDEFEVVKTEVCTDNLNGQYPSDHFFVMASLRLKSPYVLA